MLNQKNTSLFKHNTFLTEQFARLHEKREGKPVFLVEHGYSSEGILELQQLVGNRLENVEPSLSAWRGLELTITTAIAEIGYTYRGTGTDFWPKTCEVLNTNISIASREEISKLFKFAFENHGIANPIMSNWVKAYRHIAWPIRNALVPLEIHQSLASALQRVLSSGVSILNDEVFLDELNTIASGMWSNRLQDWLKDQTVALQVCRHLVKIDSEESKKYLEKNFLERVSEDLQSNRIARKSITTARRYVSSRRSKNELEFRPPSFVVSILNGRAHSLLVKCQKPSRSTIDRYLRDFGINNTISSAEALTKSTSLESFLSGNLLEIGQVSSQPTDLVLGQINTQNDKPELVRMLSFLQPTPSFIFEYSVEDGLFEALTTETSLIQSKRYLELTWSRDYKVNPYKEMEAWSTVRAIILDAGSESGSNRLKQLGFIITDKPIISIGGGIKTSIAGFNVSTVLGAPLMLVASQDGVEATLSGAGIERATAKVPTDQALSVSLPCGTFELKVNRDRAQQSYTINVQTPSDDPPFGLELNTTSPTLEEFLSGGLRILVQSPLPLESIQLTGQILQNGRLVAENKVNVPVVPANIGDNSELLQGLKATLLEIGLNPSAKYILRVLANNLRSSEWHLTRKHRAYTLDRQSQIWTADDGTPISTSRFANLTVLLPNTTLKNKDLQLGTHLQLPGIANPDTLSSGVLIGSSKLVIGQTEAIMPNPLLRTPDSHSNGIGLIPIAEAYIGWFSATAQNLFDDHFRKSALLALDKALLIQLCGDEWSKIEEAGTEFISSPISTLVKNCLEGPDNKNLDLPRFTPENWYPEIPHQDLPSLQTFLAKQFSEVLKNRPFNQVEVTTDIAEKLDEAVFLAYESMNDYLGEMGKTQFEEIDPGFSNEQWQTALQAAQRTWDKPKISRLILPFGRWEHLSTINYSTITEDGLVDALSYCHTDANRTGQKWITRKVMRTALQLWLSPDRLSTSSDWQTNLTRLLSDKQTARCIRYTALRMRESLQVSEGGRAR